MIAVTSVEQSKRLIEAGICPMTADMYWQLFSDIDVTDQFISQDDYVLNLLYGDEMVLFSVPRCIPAWSFSAIWDLMDTTNAVFDYLTSDKSQNVLDSLVETLISFAKQCRA